MTPEQRALIVEALQPYGAGLNDDGCIVRGERLFAVRPEVIKRRLRMMGAGNLLASYPAANIGGAVKDFVEKFWFWKVST